MRLSPGFSVLLELCLSLAATNYLASTRKYVTLKQSAVVYVFLALSLAVAFTKFLSDNAFWISVSLEIVAAATLVIFIFITIVRSTNSRR